MTPQLRRFREAANAGCREFHQAIHTLGPPNTTLTLNQLFRRFPAIIDAKERENHVLASLRPPAALQPTYRRWLRENVTANSLNRQLLRNRGRVASLARPGIRVERLLMRDAFRLGLRECVKSPVM